MKALQVTVFVLLLTTTFGGILDEAKEWMKDFSDDAKNKFHDLKDGAYKKIISALPESLREKFVMRDLSDANVEDIEKLSVEAMRQIDGKMLGTMKKDQLAALARNTNFDKLVRLKNNANLLMDMMLDNEDDIIEKLRTSGVERLEARRNALIKKLGDPKTWNLAKVNKLLDNDVLRLLPRRLIDKIEDKAVLQKILDKKIEADMEGTFGLMECRIQWRIHGEPKTWNETLMESSADLPGLLKGSMPLVSAKLLNMTRKKLGQKRWNDYDVCRSVALKILEGNESTSNTKAQNKELVSDLGNLRKCLLPGDLPMDKLEEADWETLDDNQRTQIQTPKSARITLKKALKDYSKQNVTSGVFNKLEEAIAELNPSYLLTAIINANTATLESMAKYFERFNGPSVRGKVMLVGEKFFQELGAGVPNSVVEGVQPWRFRSLTKDKTKVMAKHLSLTKLQRLTVEEKLSPEDMEPTTNHLVKCQVPLEKLKSLSTNELLPFLDDPSPSNPARSLFSQKILKDVENLTSVNVDYQNMPHLWGPSEFNKTKPNDVEGVLMNLNSVINNDVCCLLKDRYCKLHMELWDFDSCQEVGENLKPVDVSALLPCVVACFGEAVIRSLDDESKTILAHRHGMDWAAPAYVPANIRSVIAREGYKAMGGDEGEVIPAGVLADLYLNVVNLDGAALKRIPPGCGADELLIGLNDLMTIPSAACLDEDQQDAVAKLIMDKLGDDPSKWTNVCNVSCLLHLLPKSTIEKIPAEVLTACSCDMLNVQRPKNYEAMTMMTCEEKIPLSKQKQMKDRMMEFKKMQGKVETEHIQDYMGKPSSSSGSRRKRQANGASTCDMATTDISMVSKEDIDAMTSSEVLACLPALTKDPMDKGKAEVILKKVKTERGGFDQLDNEDIANLKHALIGISVEEVKSLKVLTEGGFDDAVSTFGNVDLPSDVCKEVATKAKTDWKKPEDMSGSQIKRIGNLVSCLTPTDIAAFKIASLKEALPGLREVKDCPEDIKNALGKRIGEEMGDPKTWTEPMVGELGYLTGTLAPEKLMKIPAEAFNSLDPDAVKSMSKDHILALSGDQLKQLSSLAIASISKDQYDALPEDMKSIINEKKKRDEYKEDAAFRPPVPWSLLLLAFFFAFFA